MCLKGQGRSVKIENTHDKMGTYPLIEIATITLSLYKRKWFSYLDFMRVSVRIDSVILVKCEVLFIVKVLLSNWERFYINIGTIVNYKDKQKQKQWISWFKPQHYFEISLTVLEIPK